MLYIANVNEILTSNSFVDCDVSTNTTNIYLPDDGLFARYHQDLSNALTDLGSALHISIASKSRSVLTEQSLHLILLALMHYIITSSRCTYWMWINSARIHNLISITPVSITKNENDITILKNYYFCWSGSKQGIIFFKDIAATFLVISRYFTEKKIIL